ncbi:hypothetical protein DFS34DRAFT_614418 [Phlyctochytrium arcticum]|nr:hypothetical protein DFS34DRAFT_614418 [Phlyctochytrium arcticum]
MDQTWISTNFVLFCHFCGELWYVEAHPDLVQPSGAWRGVVSSWYCGIMNSEYIKANELFLCSPSLEVTKMSTGAVILTLSALTISHTVVLFDRVVNNARITTRNKIPLVICCISHLISRFQLMYLFDADAPRNCKAMVLVGNLCGLIVFRFTLLYLLSVLCLSLTRGLAKNDLAVKALNVVGWILFIASSVILMYQEIVTPFFTETCLQDLAKSLSSANNACFLCSFFCFAAPIIVQLFLHIKRSQGSSSKNGAIRKIYLRQLVFMVSCFHLSCSSLCLYTSSLVVVK